MAVIIDDRGVRFLPPFTAGDVLRLLREPTNPERIPVFLGTSLEGKFRYRLGNDVVEFTAEEFTAAGWDALAEGVRRALRNPPSVHHVHGWIRELPGDPQVRADAYYRASGLAIEQAKNCVGDQHTFNMWFDLAAGCSAAHAALGFYAATLPPAEHAP